MDEHTLRLDCPPYNMEENSMNNEYMQNGNGPRPTQDSKEMSMEWVMAKMDAIIHDNAYLTDAIKTLQDMQTNGHDSKAQSLGEVIHAREETNRQTLKFLEKIYDGLVPAPKPGPIETLHQIGKCQLADYMSSEDLLEMIKVIF